MKKISFLPAMLLVMVSAFATDTPAYAPHGFHPGVHPVHGHGLHLRPVRSAHQHTRPGAVFSARGVFFVPMGVAAETPCVVQVSLPGFTEADASINARASVDMTEISLPGFAEADAAINATAIAEMTNISVPGFAEADAVINAMADSEMTEITLPDFTAADAVMSAQAVLDITKISLPDYTEADADMSSLWFAVVNHES